MVGFLLLAALDLCLFFGSLTFGFCETEKFCELLCFRFIGEEISETLIETQSRTYTVE